MRKPFPMLGFPGERLIGGPEPYSGVIYAVKVAVNAEIVVWTLGNHYGLNIYRVPRRDADTLTHHADRLFKDQGPIIADDPLTVQAVIFHLIQTHLPKEVTADA